MKARKSMLGRRIPALIGFSVLSAVSSFSMAAVVDSGAVSINVPNTTAGIYLNVVTGAAGTAAGTPGWDINPWGSSTVGFQFFFPAAPAASQGCVLSGADCAALAAGTIIGPASTFSASGTQPGTNFRTTGDRNVGFRFQNEATGVVNYGYAVIRNTTGAGGTSGFPATIIRYVYDNAGVAITIGGAGADVSPNLAYNPVSGGAITLTASGANATGNIAITPSGGTGAATTTVGSCVFAANTASLASSPATLTFTGPTTTAQNLGLTCVRQVAAVTALLTCQETQSDGTPAGPQPRTFNVTCPAAVAADVSPNIAFTPTPLTLTGTGAANGTLTGTPSGGTGAATTTATCVDDAGGPAFTITPAARTFTGTTTTAQTYVVGCSTAAAAASGTITCSQVQSDGTNPAATQITVNCPATVATSVPTLSPAGKLIAIFSMLGLGLLGFAVTRRA